jgi:DNA-binding YbaB/EbfC family protein
MTIGLEFDTSPHLIRPAMPDFMKILSQAQEMQKNFQKIQDELQQKTVSGSAGGGMVSVEVSGTGQMKKIKLEPSVVNPADIEMLEDLIVVAIADAQAKAQKMAQEEMGKLTGGLNLPFKLPF